MLGFSSFTYNGVGQVLTTTDPLGIVTQYGYDARGNPTTIVRDAGPGHINQTTSMTYSALGDVTSVTDPNGNVTTRTYDAKRQPLTTTLPGTSAAPNGVVATLAYDPDGRVLSTAQSANGTVLRTTSTTYSLTGQPATATDPNGNITTYAYDAADRLASTTDPTGRTTNYSYDAMSRRNAVSNPAISANPLLRQAYTPDGLPASLTDANQNITNFAYDGFDRLATTTYPLGSTEAFTYDADGNVLTAKTRANQTITFSYDTLNRLQTKAPPSRAPVVTYSYDLTGRRTGVSDTSAAITPPVPPSPSALATSYGYDALNRPTTVSFTSGVTPTPPATASVTFNHSYNKANQRVGQSASDNTWLNYPAATPTVTYTANALNQYTAVGKVSPTYDANEIRFVMFKRFSIWYLPIEAIKRVYDRNSFMTTHGLLISMFFVFPAAVNRFPRNRNPIIVERKTVFPKIFVVNTGKPWRVFANSQQISGSFRSVIHWRISRRGKLGTVKLQVNRGQTELARVSRTGLKSTKAHGFELAGGYGRTSWRAAAIFRMRKSASLPSCSFSLFRG